jgi:hypothetical protein
MDTLAVAQLPTQTVADPDGKCYFDRRRCPFSFSDEVNTMLALDEQAGGKLLGIKISGKLTKEDYEQFVPKVEELIKQHGKLRVLLEMHDFHGWEMGALWEDIKFDVKHFSDIERLAMVGNSKWEKGMAAFCKPFTTATIKYFDEGQRAEAEKWIAEGLPA